MPRNGSGTYSLPAGNPVVTGTTISSTVQNNTMSDVASALTQSLSADGQTTPTANIPMGGFKITGLANGTVATDAAALGQVQGSTQAFGTATGTDTILLTLSPAITAYASGQTFRFLAAGTNTTAATLNVNSVGAKNIKKRMSGGIVALVAGDIVNGVEYSFTYDGTQFMLNEQRPYSQGANVTSAGTTVLDTTTGDYIHITGTTTITAITLAQGEQRTVVFDGILTLTNGASLILPSAANITTAAGDVAVLRGEASSVVRCISYIPASGRAVIASTVARNYIAGCTMSTAGGSGTMSIAAGQAVDSTNVAFMALSAISKTTSGWAVGSATGGLDTGSIANNTWYHFFVIQRVDTGVVDVLFSLSATAPTMPANYTLKRRIGSMKTNGSAQWIAFTQIGNRFRWATPVLDVSATAFTAYTSTVMSAPTGIQNIAFGRVVSGTGGSILQIRPVGASDAAPTLTATPLGYGTSAAGAIGFAWQEYTDTSAQISIGGNTTVASYLTTEGWFDNRGTEL